MFLHWKVKSFCPLEKNHSSQPTGIGWELCSTSLRGGDYLHNFFGILCMVDLSLIPTLSISINIDSWRLIILWVKSNTTLFYCSNFPVMATENNSNWPYLSPFDIHHIILVLSCFLLLLQAPGSSIYFLPQP